MPFDPARVRAICFDVDGTLSDTDDQLVGRIQEFLARLPLLSGTSAKRLARRIVMDAETPVNTVYGLSDRLGIDDELAQLWSYLDRLKATEPEPIEHLVVPGIADMIHALAVHFPMCAISTGSEERVADFFDHFGIREPFTALVTAQTTERMKPYPDPVLHAAEAMGVAPEHCVMIGDTVVDMLAAKAAGAQAIGVLCGFGTEDELRRDGADLIVDATPGVVDLLLTAEGTPRREPHPRTVV
jgi:HAD superfamily hydrolase (TIGR01549 family)